MAKKMFFLISILITASILAFFLPYMGRQQSEAEIVRKLSAVRLALTLYNVNHNKKPATPYELIKAGYLEDIPVLKLRWKMPSNEVELMDSMSIKNTGRWAYVKNPNSPDFGLFYIDSAASDRKGRPWSLL